MADVERSAKIKSHWKNWCRLCAKDDARGNVKVNCTREQGSWDNVLVMAIRKYFEVHMHLEDELSSVLCTECYTLISELIDFAEHVTKVQAIFEVLRRTDTNAKSQLDVAALREQYGLRENDWTHIIKPSDYEGELEESESKPVQVKEFVDLSASIELEELIKEQEEAPTNLMVSLEELASVGCANAKGIETNATKRPRGRPRSTGTRRQKVDAALVVTRAEPTFSAVTEPKHKCRVLASVPESPPISSEYIKSGSFNLDEDSEFLPAMASPSTGISDLVDAADALASDSEQSESIPVANSRGIGGRRKRSQRICKKCGKSYQNAANYQKHLEQGCRSSLARPRVDKSVRCDICNKTLSSPAALKLHVEGIHQNSKPYICDGCGKMLKSITALKEHKLVHTEERPFVCPVCKAGFKNKARLKIHNQIHAEPNYVCNVCGKKLQTRRTWNMHKLVHTEERRFKCDVCGAGFKRSKALKTHLLSHTGLRPYVCVYCSRTFACNANCRAHKQKKHPEEYEKEVSEGASSRLAVPTLDELRVMTQTIPKESSET